MMLINYDTLMKRCNKVKWDTLHDSINAGLVIMGAPVADAQPVRHGKWIDVDTQMYTWKVRCDQCGHERSMLSTQGRYPKYCEECGARMDGKTK